ncbi:zinc-binding dehydrogenase [Brachybacterium tyrofermentans]|uniref:zinc-binding dehydrogenase n=1 Tax=Brachybacterium tyrofermentans TaxID=47848 RepID=UPI003FD4CBF1
MSRTVRAAVLREIGTPMRIEQIELADPGDEELLVEIEAAGVCHSDLHYVHGGLRAPLPLVPGHEGAGRVIAAGSRTSGRIRVGDRVALLWRPNCGRCPPCISGAPVMCESAAVQAATGGLMDGSIRLADEDGPVHHLMGVSCFAEQVVVHERSVVPVPEDIPAEVAAIAGCAVITGVGVTRNVIGGCLGDPVVVMGAGGVGLAAVMGARLAGARPLIAVDIDEGRLERAARFGATATVDSRQGDVVEQVLELTGGGAAWVIEAVGRPETLQSAVQMLRPRGMVVAVGLGEAGQTVALPINDLVQRQKKVVGSLYGSSVPARDLPEIFDLYRAGELPLDELVGTRYALEDVSEALDSLASGAVGRSVIVPQGVRS